MSRTAQGKLHGLTWAPSRRFVLVVTYQRDDYDHKSTWAESWPVAAFGADGDPIVADGKLLAVPELLERYTGDPTCSDVSWSMEAAEDAPVGCRRLG